MSTGGFPNTTLDSAVGFILTGVSFPKKKRREQSQTCSLPGVKMDSKRE